MDFFGNLFNNLEAKQNDATSFTCPQCKATCKIAGHVSNFVVCAVCEAEFNIVDGDRLEAAQQLKELEDWTVAKRKELFGKDRGYTKYPPSIDELPKTTDNDTIIDIPYEEV